MNKLMIFLAILVVLLLAGYFFVQWANRPENVQAVLKEREAEQLRKAQEDSLAKENTKIEAALQQKTETELQLVLEESFTNNTFTALEKFEGSNITFKDQELFFQDAIVLPSKRRSYVLGLSKEEVENFVAELHFEGREGCGIGVGIIFGASTTTDKGVRGHTATVGEYAETYIDGTEREDIEDLPTNQKVVVRFQKKGKKFTITLNNKVVMEQTVENYKYNAGKIGLYVDYFNSSKDFNRSAKCTITKFKVWKW